MKAAFPNRITAALIMTGLGLGGYAAAYFTTTEIFHGQFGNRSMDFRLFDSPSHQAMFFPLVALEEQLRSGPEIDFYGHVRNGASLPPARSAVALSEIDG